MNKTEKKAIESIIKNEALLVFPIKNAERPLSLWKCLYPRTKMRWEWDESGDSKVFDLWRLREKLSKSGKVVYGKYYKGRATFYSRDHFKNLLQTHRSFEQRKKYKHGAAAEIISVLEDSSPLSTKQLKKIVGLKGKFNEPTYNRALKDLWNDYLIVGWGEKDEGAFPSLQIGATSLLFEDLWLQAKAGF